MDFIRPISPDRDVDPLLRVERAREERERREHEAAERRDQRRPSRPAAPAPAPAPATAEHPPADPFEGDDGHLHIDTTA